MPITPTSPQDIGKSLLGQSSSFFNGGTSGGLDPAGQSYAPTATPSSQTDPFVTNPNAMPQTLSAPKTSTVAPVVPTGPTPATSAKQAPILAPATMPAQPGIDVASVQAQLAAMKASAENLYKQAGELKAKESTSASGLTATSAGSVNAENQTKQAVTQLNAPSTGEKDARTASADYQKNLDDQVTALEKRRAEQLAQIEASYQQTKAQTEKAQAKESGTFTTQLARMGGFLGNSASQTGTMINLAVAHRDEMGVLEQKKQAAIQIANSAIDDKQFALAQAKVKEAKDLEATINDRKDKFFQQSLQLTQENRAENKATRDAANDMLKGLEGIDPAKIAPENLSAIDAVYFPGFSKNYLDIQASAAKAKSDKDRMDTNAKLVTMLKDLPAGKEFSFPDGSTYTGIGSAGDIQTIQEVDNNGTLHVIAMNKLTGETNISSFAGYGKTKDAGEGGSKYTKSQLASVTQEVVARTQKELEATKGATASKGGDERYDPDVFLDAYSKAQQLDPAVATSLYETFIYNPSGNTKELATKYFSQSAIDRMREQGLTMPEFAVTRDGGTTKKK